jgi:hypothetical protein
MKIFIVRLSDINIYMEKNDPLQSKSSDSDWRNQFFSPIPPHMDDMSEEERTKILKEFEWYEQEKQREKDINHDWMFHKWLKER